MEHKRRNLIMIRCEEMHMLKVDMATVIQYWFNRAMATVRRLDELSINCDDLYIHGAHDLFWRTKCGS